MPQELRSAIDAYIGTQPDPKPTRSEAIRTLLREGLAGKGLLQATDDPIAVEERIEVLEAKVASMPDPDGERSPSAAMNIMKRAIAEAELVGLHQKRKRIRKAKPK